MTINYPFYLRIILVFVVCYRFLESVYMGKHFGILFTSGSFGFHLAFLLILLFWSFKQDCIAYVKGKKMLHLVSSLVIVLSIITGISMREMIQYNFEKPDLMRVDHDGYYKGISIDFKTDSSYIVNRYDLGNHYTHGDFTFKNGLFVLDQDTISDLIVSRYFKLDTIENKVTLFQTDQLGEIIKEAVSFNILSNKKGELCSPFR